MLFGSASGDKTIGGNYYSWSIGEVIVFNDESKPIPFMAQSMQSYINPPKPNCLQIVLTAGTEELCNGSETFKTVIKSAITPSTSDVLEFQWQFKENASDAVYSNIKGSTTTPILADNYTPYFPGFYRLCIKNQLLDCDSCSKPIQIQLLKSKLMPPFITGIGHPTYNLKVTFDTKIEVQGVQWYAYIPTLKKYLLIVGAAKPDLNIRYDGDYMVIVSYKDGCKMSYDYFEGGYHKPLYRATDTKIDGNTIYIPDETAYEHSALKVFPNPATNSFTVQYESSSEIVSKAQLYSNTGLAVKEIKFNDGDFWSKTAIVNAEDLSAGVYFLKINEGDRQIVEKVVLQK